MCANWRIRAHGLFCICTHGNASKMGKKHTQMNGTDGESGWITEGISGFRPNMTKCDYPSFILILILIHFTLKKNEWRTHAFLLNAQEEEWQKMPDKENTTENKQKLKKMGNCQRASKWSQWRVNWWHL